MRCRLSSCTAPAACFYESNLTIPTYLALILVASVVGGIGYLGTATDTTSLNDALYLMSLSPQSPKVNAAPYSSTPSMLSAPQLSSPFSTCPSPPLPSSLATRALLVLTPSKSNVGGALTCVSTGFGIASNRTNSVSLGSPALRTSPISSPWKRYQKELMKLVVHTLHPSAVHFVSSRGRQVTAYRHHKLLPVHQT